MLIEPRPCVLCGRIFYTLDKNRKLCSTACQEEAARILTRKQRIRKPPSPRQCPFCGKVFLANGKKKFCSAACRIDWHKRDWAERCQAARMVVATRQGPEGIAAAARGVPCETARPVEPGGGMRK